MRILKIIFVFDPHSTKLFESIANRIRMTESRFRTALIEFDSNRISNNSNGIRIMNTPIWKYLFLISESVKFLNESSAVWFCVQAKLRRIYYLKHKSLFCRANLSSEPVQRTCAHCQANLLYCWANLLGESVWRICWANMSSANLISV